MIIYHEKQTTYPIFYIILILELPLLAYVMWLGIAQKQYGPTILLALIFAILIFALINFFWMHVKVYEDKIIFYFGIFHKIIYFKDIQSCEIQDYNFWKYWGWGIRFSLFDGTWAWVTRSGKGVLIKTNRREYFLSTKDPEQLRKLIFRYLAR